MVTSRQYMSGMHLQAAHMFFQKSAELHVAGSEDAPVARDPTGVAAYVSATILHSVCYMESHINEHFMDIIDGKHPQKYQVPPGVSTATTEAWERMHHQRRASVVRKYRQGTAAFGVRNGLEASLEAAQALIFLRNALVHYQPEDLVDFKTGIGREERLRGLASLSRYLSRGLSDEGVYAGSTRLLLRHETARWALRTSVELTDAFHTAIDFQGPMYVYQGSLRERIEQDLAA